MLKYINQIIYIFEISKLKYNLFNYFFFIFNNISIDIICLLYLYIQKFNNIKLRKFNEINYKNIDLEYFFKNNNFNLMNYNTCLFLNVDIFMESTVFFLKLKKRFFFKNLNIFNFGGLINNNIKSSFLGSSLSVLINLVEGINIVCQNLYNKNSIICFSSELFKQKINVLSNLILFIFYLKRFCNIVYVNNSVYENSSFSINDFISFSNYNVQQLNSIYLLNINFMNKKFINKISKLFLLNSLKINKNVIVQNFYINQSSFNLLNKNFLIYLPVKNCFQEKEFIINSKGFVVFSSKLIKTKLKSHWNFIRNFFNYYKKKSLTINYKNYLNGLNFNFKTNKLTLFFFIFISNNLLEKKKIISKNNSFFLSFNILKTKKYKYINVTLKYWLNDFFLNETDNYSFSSLFLSKLSTHSRQQNSNFF